MAQFVKVAIPFHPRRIEMVSKCLGLHLNGNVEFKGGAVWSATHAQQTVFNIIQTTMLNVDDDFFCVFLFVCFFFK